jgi:subtilisin family serine protease
MAKMARAGRRFFFIVCLVLALGIPAHAAFTPIPVIVQISPLANINNIAAALGASIVDSIPGANTYLLNVGVIQPNFSILASLLGIQSAELDNGVSIPNFALLGLVRLPATPVADWYKNQPSWRLIEADKAQAYSRGNGVIVADINARVDTSHPALAGHFTGGYDFIATRPGGYPIPLNQSETNYLEQSETNYLEQSETNYLEQFGGVLQPINLLTVNPAYSHGTLCAGVIAAIAPGSMIMPIRAFDDNGQTDLFTLAKAVRWAADQRVQVINMSFGTRTNSRVLGAAITYARSNGIVLVGSVGNDNSTTVQYPSGYQGVMGIAATTVTDKKASFSNYGSQVDVDAPGVNIISAYPGGYYSIVSGTSFSAPAVAATAALVLSYSPSLGATGTASAITAGAVNIDYNNPNYANQLGHGRIDVLRAVKPN